MDKQRLNLAAARARLAAMKGKTYWRSLDELADTEEFQTFLHREFPEKASEWFDPVSRRSFLRMMGASLALAGLGACTRQPEEKIVPYATNPPEQFIPGVPVQYATAMPFGGYGLGVLVESHMGRPTKVEGNERHPASLGSSDIFAQASILSLYDPDRSQVVIRRARPNTWTAFIEELTAELNGQKNKHGAGLRLLTETVTSPTLAAQLQKVLEAFPQARWHQYEPVGQDNTREGARLAFGEYVDTQYRLDRAEVIVALDADFLSWGPAKVRYAREFAARRKVRGGTGAMNRLYVIETTPTLTGSVADHCWTVAPHEVEATARQLLASPTGWVAAIAKDLESHRGRCAVLVGETQPPAVHALAHALNQQLGNIGQTVIHTAPVEARPENQTESLRALVDDMAAGQVEVLLILGGNPVFDAPADLKFRAALEKVKWRARLGMYDDETSEWCHWHVPQAHYLETWGDIRAFDGTVSLQQPLIAPLYDGKSPLEVLALATGTGPRKGHDILRDYWKTHGLSDDKLWQAALHDGVVPGTAAAEKRVRATAPEPSTSTRTGQLDLLLRPDPCIWDGAWANNGWLQELPKPFTKLTWDNTALIAPAAAERLGLSNGDVVELKVAGRSLEAPVWIFPGQPAGSITLHLGYGRTRAGRVGTGPGVNAYALRTAANPWTTGPVEVTRTGRKIELAVTQSHHLMEGRHLVRSGTLEEYREHPEFVQHMVHHPPEGSLFPRWKYEGHSWGMAIDLSSCIGCNACVVACQSENNIPVVGKEQVARGREMHWIRIDHYYEGDLDHPESHHQPVPCMHCESAPCEIVCPVAATSHSAEGLNEMTYNRCVGTRYCANNCPYKVRRFNFLQYTDQKTPSLKLLANPDVTVRMRGVMEKCTYCVQRINTARITAKKEDRKIRDGEVTPACAQACPAEAIVFGDLNDPTSRVTAWKAEKLNYGLLEELNTLPRTTYLAKLKNPNPELTGEGHS